MNGLRVNIVGIPAQGAKSRVETQIKLGIQLVNQNNELVGLWTHMRLPDYMVAKEKNKQINAKNLGPEVIQALNNGTCLSLDASVVCQSDRSKVIQTCTGCVLRERKRAQRKKSLGKKKGPETMTPAVDDDSPEQMALEQRKILLFNCTEIAEFSTGELTLPTRITCYCRHHGEKQGFCIQFSLRDCHNNLVATGISPPIMITDDHKASKVKKPDGTVVTKSSKKPAKAIGTGPGANGVNLTNNNNIKVPALTPPSSPATPGDDVESDVDMGSGSQEDDDTEESEMDSASSNASPSPLQPTLDMHGYESNSLVDLITQFSQPDGQVPSPTSPSMPAPRISQNIQNGGTEYHALASPPMESQSHPQQFQSMNSFIYSSAERLVPEQLVDIPISLAPPSSQPSNNTPGLSPTSTTGTDVQSRMQDQQKHQQQEHERQALLQQQHIQFQQLQQQALFSHLNSVITPAPSNNPLARRTSTSGGVGPVRRRRAPNAPNPLGNNSLNVAISQPAVSLPGSTNTPSLATSVAAAATAASSSILTPAALPSILGLSSSLAMVPPTFIAPRMTRLIPNQGPCFGGIEVTILGSNFYAGLTAMFDSTPALPTQFWSPNTLICILPPRITPGTTVVTFKEHPNLGLGQPGENNELMLFTYVDESDKALMELALQVVGLKMTGRLEDARNIALRIVGSQVANGNQQQQSSGQQQQQQQQQQNQMNGPVDYASLVRELILSFGGQEMMTNFHTSLEDRILTLLTILSELPDSQQQAANLARRDTGHRLLHLAAMKGFERLVAALLHIPGIEMDGLDVNGYSALHYACWRGEIGSANLLVNAGANVSLRSVHGVASVDLARMHTEAVASQLLTALRSSNSWVDAGALEVDEYESAKEDEGEPESELDDEAAESDTEDHVVPDGEDSGIWLEHFATESDDLDEYESEDSFDINSLTGSEIEDLPWIDRGEWIGEEVSDDSSAWSGCESDKAEEIPAVMDRMGESTSSSLNTDSANIVQAPSSPNLIPLAQPLTQDPKTSSAPDMSSNWLQKTLSQIQVSSPTFDFEFFKALNQILPEKGTFLMNMPSMPTSIQAFNANIGTFIPYNFTKNANETSESDVAAAAQAASASSVSDEKEASSSTRAHHGRNKSISGEMMLDENAISHELWNLHTSEEHVVPTCAPLSPTTPGMTASAATTLGQTLSGPKATIEETQPSRYLSVYHEPFSATSVLQQPVNSYAMPTQDSQGVYGRPPMGHVSSMSTVSPLSKVRRFYPPMSSSEMQQQQQQQAQMPMSDIGQSSVVRGGRRIITEFMNNGAIVGGVAVAERAAEVVGENRHIQELRARYHQKMKRLKKDKMLFLFWVPVLLVMLALTIIRIASTFDVAREWMGGLMGLAGIQV